MAGYIDATRLSELWTRMKTYMDNIWSKLQPDSGWKTITISKTNGTANFGVYDDDSGSIPQYRKVGTTVILHGKVTDAGYAANGESDVELCVLPEGYRPPYAISKQFQSTYSAIYTVTVEANGQVRLCRTSDALFASVWLPFHLEFECANDIALTTYTPDS